jgi:dTDP-3-amino-3,4,6-trideoxy-alpha-D-glucose transaminase
MIPFYDLQTKLKIQKTDIEDVVSELVRSGVTIGGEAVNKFEKDFSRYLGSNNFVGVGNGLDALRLTLIALGIGPGDEVIVPAFTFIATWLAVTQCGATPVPVDVNMQTAGMNISELPITSKTKAVIYVHLFGIAENLTPLRSALDLKGIHLIEDAAQAHGASESGKMAGTFGIAGCFSFYPTKNLGGIGDGGGIATGSSILSESLKSLRSYGSGISKYDHEIEGWNSRLDSIQALYLSSQLLNLDIENKARRSIATRYLSEIHFNERVKPLTTNLSDSNVWHHFVVLAIKSRVEFRQALSDSGVSTDIHYPEPAYSAKCFGNERSPKFPNTNFISDNCVSIPIYPWLTENQVESVIRGINKVIREIA